MGRGVGETQASRDGGEEAEERPDEADDEVGSGEARDEERRRRPQLLEPGDTEGRRVNVSCW